MHASTSLQGERTSLTRVKSSAVNAGCMPPRSISIRVSQALATWCTPISIVADMGIIVNVYLHSDVCIVDVTIDFCPMPTGRIAIGIKEVSCIYIIVCNVRLPL
jgi:hypothetical protein